MLLEIGSRVLGSDGRCGRIAGLVVVPGATGGEVTHLVVHAVLPHVADRLVPVSAVDTETSEWDRKTHHGHDCELAWTSDEVLDAAPATMSTVVDLGEDHALPHMERSTGLAAPLTWSLRADEGCGWPEDDGSSVVGTGRYQVVTEPQNPPGTVRLDAAAHVVAEDGSRVGTVRAVEVAADWTIKRVVSTTTGSPGSARSPSPRRCRPTSRTTGCASRRRRRTWSDACPSTPGAPTASGQGATTPATRRDRVRSDR